MENNVIDVVNTSAGVVKARIQHLLATKGLSHQVLWKALGLTESGYFKMLRRGGQDLATLEVIAKRLDTTVTYLLGEVTDPKPALDEAPQGRQRYIEERLADLETEVRKLKERLRSTATP